MNKWPKKLPALSKEQEKIRNDFVKHWHNVLPNKYSIIEKFNHYYPVFLKNKNCTNTLEIGAGLGEHLFYENLINTKYHTVELRDLMSQVIRKRFPLVKTITGDCQKTLPFEKGYFDRIIAIHVLEHLPNLPETIKEVYRLLKTDGQFQVVIPCEGGLLYTLARNVSARRIFEKKYKQSYDWFIASEHINKPDEIMNELNKYFRISNKVYFPFLLPSVSANLCIGLTLKKL